MIFQIPGLKTPGNGDNVVGHVGADRATANNPLIKRDLKTFVAMDELQQQE